MDNNCLTFNGSAGNGFPRVKVEPPEPASSGRLRVKLEPPDYDSPADYVMLTPRPNGIPHVKVEPGGAGSELPYDCVMLNPAAAGIPRLGTLKVERPDMDEGGKFEKACRELGNLCLTAGEAPETQGTDSIIGSRGGGAQGSQPEWNPGGVPTLPEAASNGKPRPWKKKMKKPKRHKAQTADAVKVASCKQKSFCCFCTFQLGANAETHFVRRHKDEVEVADALAEEGPRKRSALLRVLRDKGNRMHNAKVMAKGKGVLVVSRVSPKARSADGYTPCPACLEYYPKSQKRHACTGKPKPKRMSAAPPEGRPKAKPKPAAPSPEAMLDKALQRVLRKVESRQENLAALAKADMTILEHARSILMTAGMHKEKNKKKSVYVVALVVRALAQLLLAVRKQSGMAIPSLEEAIVPANLPTIVAAIQDMARYSAADGKYAAPKVARRLYTALNSCAQRCKAACLKRIEELRQQASNCEQFMELFTIPEAVKRGAVCFDL